jgi:hypothetical protein
MTGITFTCTGEGPDDKHDCAVAEALNVAFPHANPPGRRRRGRNAGLDLRCPVCGLTKPALGYKKRKRLAEAGITEVDISGYPF